jgi:hypothetical protein
MPQERKPADTPSHGTLESALIFQLLLTGMRFGKIQQSLSLLRKVSSSQQKQPPKGSQQ